MRSQHDRSWRSHFSHCHNTHYAGNLKFYLSLDLIGSMVEHCIYHNNMHSGELIVFILLLFGSAFFSGTELALMSVPFHKINTRIKKGNKTALMLKKLKENSDRLLVTILI